MSVYQPNFRHYREVLIFCFNAKVPVRKAHKLLLQTYGEIAFCERACREWYHRFQNGDFDIEIKNTGGRERSFSDEELEELLDNEACYSQGQLAKLLGVTQQTISRRLKAMGRKRRKRSCTCQSRSRSLKKRKS